GRQHLRPPGGIVSTPAARHPRLLPRSGHIPGALLPPAAGVSGGAPHARCAHPRCIERTADPGGRGLDGREYACLLLDLAPSCGRHRGWLLVPGRAVLRHRLLAGSHLELGRLVFRARRGNVVCAAGYTSGSRRRSRGDERTVSRAWLPVATAASVPGDLPAG